MRVHNWILAVFLAGFLLNCATVVPVKHDSVNALDTAKNRALALAQYRLDSDIVFHRFVFESRSGKDYEVTIEKKIDTEGGIVFELPEGEYRLYRFVGNTRRYELSKYSPYFSVTKGEVSHVGFLDFRKKGSYQVSYQLVGNARNFASPLRKLRRKLPKGVRLVNGYNGKRIPLSLGSKSYRIWDQSRGAKPTFAQSAMDCVKEESKTNTILTGRLLYNVTVANGKTRSIRISKSDHTASRKYENCILNVLKRAQHIGSFKAEIPGFPF